MKKAIITGASGFVGRALTKELLEKNIEVVAILRPNSSNKNKLPENNKLQIVECELSDLSTLKNKKLNNADVFYHLAWEGSAGSARSDERLQLSNIQHSADALRLAKSLDCKRFIGAGSIMEKETYFATNGQGNKLNSAYIYGIAKLTAHCITKALAAEIEIEHIWPMITNAYGVGEKSPRFINMTLRKIINQEKLEFTAGTQNYDFIFIDDVARAFRLIGETGKPFCQYILGSGEAKPLRGFIEQVGRTLAPNAKLLFGDIPYTGVNLDISEFSIKNLEKDTSFSINTPFIDGIKKTYNWLSKEENK